MPLVCPSLSRRRAAYGPAALAWAPAWGARAAAPRQALTVAAISAGDKIIEAALPAWKKLHPTVGIQVVSRPFADRHTAMTTARSPSVYLHHAMALEAGDVGRFAQGGGLCDLARAPCPRLRTPSPAP
jgi:multiple sugar transport system substrate-binding protein